MFDVYPFFCTKRINLLLFQTNSVPYYVKKAFEINIANLCIKRQLESATNIGIVGKIVRHKSEVFLFISNYIQKNCEEDFSPVLIKILD